MTEDNSISRRSVLAATGTLGLTSLAGCLDPNSDTGLFADDKGVRPDPSGELREIKVKTSPTEQSNPYFVALSDDILNSGDITVFDGQQIRIKVQNDIEGSISEPCLYTVNNNPDYTAEEENTIWMSEKGMERLGVVEGSLLVIQPFSASPRFDTRDAGKDNDELIEQYINNEEERENILFLAPHGGDLFSKTELQALRGSSIESYSSWALMGYGKSRESAMNRWYNPPNRYMINSFLGLLELDYPFEYAISFSGLNKRDDATNKEVVIGGLAEDGIKEEIKRRLEIKFTPDYNIEDFREAEEAAEEAEEGEDPPSGPNVDPTIDINIEYEGKMSGSEPQHITNNLTENDSNGILIQQTKPLRDEDWKDVTDAVIGGIKDYKNDRR